MWEHCNEHHDGVPDQDPQLKYKMDLLSQHSSPLEHQIAEAIRIKGVQDHGKDLRDKGAWAQSQPPEEPAPILISMTRRGEAFTLIQRSWGRKHMPTSSTSRKRKFPPNPLSPRTFIVQFINLVSVGLLCLNLCCTSLWLWWWNKKDVSQVRLSTFTSPWISSWQSSQWKTLFLMTLIN